MVFLTSSGCGVDCEAACYQSHERRSETWGLFRVWNVKWPETPNALGKGVSGIRVPAVRNVANGGSDDCQQVADTVDYSCSTGGPSVWVVCCWFGSRTLAAEEKMRQWGRQRR